MSLRDENVVNAAQNLGAVELPLLAQAFKEALDEAMVEGVAVEALCMDPAIRAFGAFIAFHTNVDTATPSDYREAVTACSERLHAMPRVQ